MKPVRNLRQQYPHAKHIAGGPHVTEFQEGQRSGEFPFVADGDEHNVAGGARYRTGRGIRYQVAVCIGADEPESHARI